MRPCLKCTCKFRRFDVFGCLVHFRAKCNIFHGKIFVFRVFLAVQVTGIDVIQVNANEFSVVSCSKNVLNFTSMLNQMTACALRPSSILPRLLNPTFVSLSVHTFIMKLSRMK